MKRLLRNLSINMLGLIVSTVTTILVMVKGWGLKPVNWWYILLVSFIGYMMASALVALTHVKEDKDE